MPSHVFEAGLKVNTEVYLNMLKSKPWMDEVAEGRPYVFQQDGAPCAQLQQDPGVVCAKPPLLLEEGSVAS
jgi:hypothetical protein